MSKIRIATAALSNLIYAGYPNKRGDGFKEPRHEVTSDVLKAVIEHVGEGKTKVIHVDGKPAYEISIKNLARHRIPHGGHMPRPASERKEREK